MGESKRKTYTSSFKAKVGLEAIRGVKTVNEIGQEYGVHPVQVGQWKKEILEQAGTLFESKRGRRPVDAQSAPERLYSEIGRLKMELDWCRVATGEQSPVATRQNERTEGTRVLNLELLDPVSSLPARLASR